MKLDKRLRAIAELVPQGAVLADVGSDHAYLPSALLLDKKIKYAIATDVAAGPCKVAQTTLAMQGLTKSAEVRQGDGLQPLKPNEADCIVIAGMGGNTIMEILAATPDVAKSAAKLILQPMQVADRLRQYLVSNGYAITDEDLVQDEEYLYEIIVARPSENSVSHYSEAELLLGPVLLAKHHPLLALQFAKQKGILQRVLDGMEQSAGAVNTEKYVKIKKLLQEVESLEKC